MDKNEFALFKAKIIKHNNNCYKLKSGDIIVVNFGHSREWICIFNKFLTYDNNNTYLLTHLDSYINSKAVYYKEKSDIDNILCAIFLIKSIRLATPVEAAELLTHNIKNRPDIIKLINKYIKDYNNGK